MGSQIEQYLTHHAEPLELPSPAIPRRFALTIPAFDERPDFLDRVLGQVPRSEVLTIVTVNVPEHATPDAVIRTRQLAESLQPLEGVIVLERVKTPIPKRQGVGLARKLAADLACALINRGDVDCPLIFMTDADAILPPDYFEQAATRTAPGTYLYPFRHYAEDAERDARKPELQELADIYELHLRHYVAGLEAAQSPYAYQTLGSTIAMHAQTYAIVRGVPRRNAGEDFYLLNKAAKVAPVTSLATPRVSITARLSHRVPFGTGPALQSMPARVEDFVSYPPAVFEDLALLLNSFKDWAVHDIPMHVRPEIEHFLNELGWKPGTLERQHSPGSRRWRAALEWFDGFRTMRFIRARQQQMPTANLIETLRVQRGFPAADSRRPAAVAAELLRDLRTAESERVHGVAAAIETHLASSM